MEACKTVKVKPWGKGQGDFVEINEEDFDKDRHELYKEPKGAAKSDVKDDGKGGNDDGGKTLGAMTAAELKTALDSVGVAYKPNASKADLLALAEDFQKNGVPK